MTTQVNGASKRAVSPRRVPVTGRSGYTGRRAFHALLGADVTVAGSWRGIPQDRKPGPFTVWPELSEAEK